jgi:uncharacterized protein (TIGR03083 family)
MGPWVEIKSDREAFADYLAALSPEDWSQSSLCDGWTVKDVAVHMLVIPTFSKGQVFRAFAGSGFNLDKMSAKLVAKLSATMSPEQVVTTTRQSAGSENAPPGLKPLGVFGELLIHTTDASDAVGKPFDLPVEHYVTGLEYTKGVDPVLGAKKRIAGLNLRATDADWSTGDGPLVEGDAKHLLSAMTGRTASFDSLTGDGVATMQAR